MDSKILSPIRELTTAELPQLNQLVSESFGYESPHSFFEDFPVWNSDRVRRFGIFDGTTLIAHVGIRFCEMKVPGENSQKVGMIGAVATSEDFRGQGLSSKLLNEVCAIADRENCDWTLLWGSEHDFYKKFGFELHGEQFQAVLAHLEGLPENKIPRIKRGWDARIFNHLQSVPSGIALQDSDQEWISRHSTVNWFVHDHPFAFAGYERGLDLPHILHEYGGDEHALKEVLAYILSLDLSARILGQKDNLQKMGFEDQDLIEEYLCLARPHPEKPGLAWKNSFWVSGLSAC